MEKITLNISNNNIQLNIPRDNIKLNISDTKIVYIGGEYYTGLYEIIPSTVIQTLNTTGKTLERNIIIEPIPKSYGLITYNGFGITVS